MTQIIVNARMELLLEKCQVEVRVIRACDKTLMTRTPLPGKPDNEKDARRLLNDLRYLAWEMEGRRNTFLLRA